MDLPNLQIVKDAPPEPQDEGPRNKIGECRRFPPTFDPVRGPIFPITSDKDRFGRTCGCGQCIPTSGNKPLQDCSQCKCFHEISDPDEIAEIVGDFAEEEEEEAPEGEGEAPAPEAIPEPPAPEGGEQAGG